MENNGDLVWYLASNLLNLVPHHQNGPKVVSCLCYIFSLMLLTSCEYVCSYMFMIYVCDLLCVL